MEGLLVVFCGKVSRFSFSIMEVLKSWGCEVEMRECCDHPQECLSDFVIVEDEGLARKTFQSLISSKAKPRAEKLIFLTDHDLSNGIDLRLIGIKNAVAIPFKITALRSQLCFN